MRRLGGMGDDPISRPLVAEEVLELHLARLLLLFKHCGVSGRIDSLVKMAKLDFFVRYPEFFQVAADAEGAAVASSASGDSRMVRYRYGPWDERYYRLLGDLESLGLLSVEESGNSYRLSLTDKGKEAAARLEQDPSFADLVSHMKIVKKVLGAKSGTRLKAMVYELFEKEVAERPIGEAID